MWAVMDEKALGHARGVLRAVYGWPIGDDSVPVSPGDDVWAGDPWDLEEDSLTPAAEAMRTQAWLHLTAIIDGPALEETTTAAVQALHVIVQASVDPAQPIKFQSARWTSSAEDYRRLIEIPEAVSTSMLSALAGDSDSQTFPESIPRETILATSLLLLGVLGHGAGMEVEQVARLLGEDAPAMLPMARVPGTEAEVPDVHVTNLVAKTFGLPAAGHPPQAILVADIEIAGRGTQTAETCPSSELMARALDTARSGAKQWHGIVEDSQGSNAALTLRWYRDVHPLNLARKLDSPRNGVRVLLADSEAFETEDAGDWTDSECVELVDVQPLKGTSPPGVVWATADARLLILDCGRAFPSPVTGEPAGDSPVSVLEQGFAGFVRAVENLEAMDAAEQRARELLGALQESSGEPDSALADRVLRDARAFRLDGLTRGLERVLGRQVIHNRQLDEQVVALYSAAIRPRQEAMDEVMVTVHEVSEVLSASRLSLVEARRQKSEADRARQESARAERSKTLATVASVAIGGATVISIFAALAGLPSGEPSGAGSTLLVAPVWRALGITVLASFILAGLAGMLLMVQRARPGGERARRLKRWAAAATAVAAVSLAVLSTMGVVSGWWLGGMLVMATLSLSLWLWAWDPQRSTID